MTDKSPRYLYNTLMAKFRQTVISAIMFLGLIGPFAVAWLLSMHAHRSASAAAPVQYVAAPSVTIQPTPLRPARHAASPVWLGGDGKTLWLVRPVVLDGKDASKEPTFELIQRSSNSTQWISMRLDTLRYFEGVPRGLAVVGPPAGSSVRASAYVAFPGGAFMGYAQGDKQPIPSIPYNNNMLAVHGSSRGIYAVTYGADHAATDGRAALRLPVGSEMLPGFSSTPATASAPASATTQAAVSAAETKPSEESRTVNAWWFYSGRWEQLPTFGPPTEGVSPSPQCAVGTVYQSGRMIVMWVDPMQPGKLVVRSLKLKQKTEGWSKPVVSELPRPLTFPTRLFAVLLDDVVYVLWPAANNEMVDLQGGLLITNSQWATDLTLPAKNMLPAMSLGETSRDIRPSMDIGVGPIENSLAVVVSTQNEQLNAMVFDNRGHQISGPAAVEPATPHRDALLLQNIVIIVLVMLLALSLWQWRKRPHPPVVPAGMRVARLYQRLIGFVIDLGIPLLIVSIVFGLNDMESFKRVFSAWIVGFTSPEAFTNAPEILFIVGGYLLHVIVGEMFFGRSIGKALVGIQVIMIDGKPPTVLSVLLRNIVRIPEMLFGVLMVYMFISDYRQRLGDLLARTIVVTPRGPNDEADEEPRERRDS